MQNLTGKVTGDTLTAAEWNQLPQEVQNVITALGQSLASGDLNQLGKAIAGYAGSGDFYTDTGTLNSIVLLPIGGLQPTPQYTNGQRVRFIAGTSNTGATVINVAGLGSKKVLDQFGAEMAGGEFTAGLQYEFYYSIVADGGLGAFIYNKPSSLTSVLPPGAKEGFVCNQNGITPATAVDINEGQMKDSTNVFDMALGSALSKQINNNWAEGGTPGAPAGGFPSALTLSANTWYHIFAIAKTNGQIDAGFDTSPVAANLLLDATDYTYFRRVGSIFVYDNGGNLEMESFFQVADYWFRPDCDTDFTTGNIPNATPANYQLMVPPDVIVEAKLGVAINNGTSNARTGVIITSPDTYAGVGTATLNPAPGDGISMNIWNQDASGSSQDQGWIKSFTDKNQQVRLVVNGNGALVSIEVGVFGWREFWGVNGT